MVEQVDSVTPASTHELNLTVGTISLTKPSGDDPAITGENGGPRMSPLLLITLNPVSYKQRCISAKENRRKEAQP